MNNEPTELFKKMNALFDFSGLSRAEWRGICSGDERFAMQRFLLALADGARVGTTNDRLALYKAAYAVLPLVEGELKDFARLLLTQHPVPMEWCDVLIHVLSDSNAREMSGSVLQALQEALAMTPRTTLEKRKMDLIKSQILSLGYRPQWLIDKISS